MTRRWGLVFVLVGLLAAGLGVRFVFGPREEGASLFQQNRYEGLFRKAEAALSGEQWDEALRIYTDISQEAPSPELMAKGTLGIGNVQLRRGDLLGAKETYQRIVQMFPNTDSVVLAQERLGEVNVAILYSPTMTPLYKKVTVQPGDSLGKIARTHGTTIELLMKANGLKSALIRPGMKLKVPSVSFSILVDKSQNQLTLKAGEEIFKIYPVATGENDSTPVGTYKITNKLINPVWYTLGAVVPSDSPENVLGSRWMGINEPGYGIHGTRDPASIGSAITAGCVRMHNKDVEELYALIPIGTEVTIGD